MTDIRKLETAAGTAGQAGFTLIEILMVVVIIGLLAGTATVALRGRMDQANKTRAKADVQAISQAVDLYELDNGTPPASLQNLISKGGERNWNGPYLKNGLPKDPWGNDYRYAKNGEAYSVSSAGPDGSFGSEDDVDLSDKN